MSDPFAEWFSEALENLRKQGISQGDLATRIGLSKNTITSWKKGHYKPRLEHLELLAKELGISPESLPSEGPASSERGGNSPPPRGGEPGRRPRSQSEDLVLRLVELDLIPALAALAKERRALRELAGTSTDLLTLLERAKQLVESLEGP